MENFTMAELGVFIGVLGGVATSIILTFQKSKCETIACCGVHCKRKIKEDEKGTSKQTGETTAGGKVSPRTLPSGLAETTRFDDLGSTTLRSPTSNP
jgi:hypothetical protein